MTKWKPTHKQEAFVNEYIIDLNGTQAAIRAGYSEKTARSAAARLLSDVNIKGLVCKAFQQRSERTKVDADWVLTELVKLYRTSTSNFLVIPDDKTQKPYLDLSLATEEQLAALDELQIDSIGFGEGSVIDKVKIKLPARLQILDRIGKHVDVQAFSERKEHVGKDGEPLDFSIPLNVMFVSPEKKESDD